MAKSKRYEGVYTAQGKKGISYGIRYTDPRTGYQVRKILKGVTSEKEASRLRSIEIADLERGHLDKVYSRQRKYKPIKFDVFAGQFLKWGETHYKDVSVIQSRVNVLNRYFGRKLLTDITPWMVEKFKMHRAKEASKRTANFQLSVLRQILDKAIEWGKLQGPNPAAQVKQFKIPKPTKPGSLTPEQAQALIDAIPTPVVQGMAEFAYYTGWRISEIRKLKWENVDSEQGTALVEDPKNGESVELELADEALEAIERQTRRGEYVFTKKNGKPYLSNLQDPIRNAAAKAGITLPSRKLWHIFRRTWASNMLHSGCDVETLRVLGNWKDIQMPLWYADTPGRSRRKEVLSKLPKLRNSRNLAEKQKVVPLSARTY